MTKTIVITGGLGYIGSNVAVHLLKLGYKVVVVDNGQNCNVTKMTEIINRNLTAEEKSRLKILGDCNVIMMCDEMKLWHERTYNNAEILHPHDYDDIYCVIHTAALKNVGESMSNPLDYYYTNLFSLVSILKWMKNAGVNRFLFAGSASVYGTPSIIPSTEESANSEPLSPYGRSKAMCEQIIRDYAKTEPDFRCVILRYFNPAGASMRYDIGENTPVPNNIIPILTSKILKQEMFTVFGSDYSTNDGTAVRDYVHIDDMVDAHMLSLDKFDEITTDHGVQILNVGSGEGSSINEVLRTMTDVVSSAGVQYDINNKVVYAPRRAGDIDTLIAEINKTKRLIGFEPKYGLYDICKSAFDYDFKS